MAQGGGGTGYSHIEERNYLSCCMKVIAFKMDQWLSYKTWKSEMVKGKYSAYRQRQGVSAKDSSLPENEARNWQMKLHEIKKFLDSKGNN